MTGKESHATVVEVFRHLPQGKVLDAPAGQGALARDLRGLGFEITCGDIDPQHFRVPGIENVQLDLNSRLPFEDGSFDHVASVAGLHRIWNMAKPIQEFRRILREGGRLVVSIPNYSGIRDRLKFLFYGSISRSVNLQSFDQHTDAEAAHFRSTLFYPQLKHLLQVNGFEILELLADKKKRTNLVLLPLAVLIRAARRLARPDVSKNFCLDDMNGPAILRGGNNIIIVCRKVAPDEPRVPPDPK